MLGEVVLHVSLLVLDLTRRQKIYGVYPATQSKRALTSFQPRLFTVSQLFCTTTVVTVQMPHQSSPMYEILSDSPRANNEGPIPCFVD